MVREVTIKINLYEQKRIPSFAELLGHGLYMSNWVVLDGNKLVKGGPS